MAAAEPNVQQFRTQMFQIECEYKGTHPFQKRFMVIDGRLKMLRIYRNEDELRSKEKDKKFKEITLEKAKISSELHTVSDKPNCVKIDADYTRYFYFGDKITAQTVLNFLQSTLMEHDDTISSLNAQRCSNPISMQHFKFPCLYLMKHCLTDFMMVIDIKKGYLMLCSMSDGYAKLHINLKKSELVTLDTDQSICAMQNNDTVKNKPNITLLSKASDVYTFWFHDENSKQSAVMCIQRVQKPLHAKKPAKNKQKHKHNMNDTQNPHSNDDEKQKENQSKNPENDAAQNIKV